jgi:putative ubiquitin-RnfH superfamily antitoxin RatB of RatAB toxin-antitoxin module
VNTTPLRIEIAYAEPARAVFKTLELAAGSCVADALRLAARDPDFAGVDFSNATIGVFGKVTRADHILKEGERIEIYRPLAADPKSARRARASKSARS